MFLNQGNTGYQIYWYPVQDFGLNLMYKYKEHHQSETKIRRNIVPIKDKLKDMFKNSDRRSGCFVDSEQL